MDKAFFKEMELLLLDMKHKLEAELGGVTRRDVRSKEGFDAEFPDYGDKEDENASEVATFTDNLALGRTLEGTLDDVVAALERLQKGTYGKCRYCQKDIDERRLRARPESSSCIDCKKKRLSKA
ncbi:MAG: TraR/DksA family transcriptional regulator [Candidatus Veblenbacteria bacterium]|nr:TraR/DksA family transcriptional regulator [Candidatus Veblenbacteria bacterium]